MFLRIWNNWWELNQKSKIKQELGKNWLRKYLVPFLLSILAHEGHTGSFGHQELVFLKTKLICKVSLLFFNEIIQVLCVLNFRGFIRGPAATVAHREVISPLL